MATAIDVTTPEERAALDARSARIAAACDACLASGTASQFFVDGERYIITPSGWCYAPEGETGAPAC